MPTSSLMMTTMLGFLLCAEAGITAPKLAIAISASMDGSRFMILISSRLVVLPASSQIGYACRPYAPKAEVIGGGADFTLSSRAHDIARAILVRAQKRSATVDFLLFIWLGGIVRRVRSVRISGHA